MKNAALDWNEILEKIESLATSELAKTFIREWPEQKTQQAAQDSFSKIIQAKELLHDGIRPYMQSLDLYSTWIHRLKKKAVLKILEIKDIRSFCLETLALQEALTSAESAWAHGIKNKLMQASEPLSAIDHLITAGGEIRSDASEVLFNLFREKEKLARDVQNTLDRLVKDHEMETILQDKYVTTREGRWVLPVRSGKQHQLGGVIHGSSQTKQTVYMEPDKIIPINNRLRQIEVEIEDEIERLLTELSNYLAEKVIEFEVTKELLLDSDITLAQAQFTSLIDGRPCQFSENEIDLKDVKHPILALSEKDIISNSVHLDKNKSILLLSGPNAGGKTVLLKSIGLAAQMARSGLPICAAENSKIPFFTNIEVGIGDSQSVDHELSTFAAHLKILSEAGQKKGYNTLILIDEICGSTDPEEGAALARSFIETFEVNQVFAVITSHLGPLKIGWDNSSKVLNGSLEYDPKSGRPTYQFISGIPGDSLALQTAKRIGIDQKIIDRAIEHLSPASQKRLSALEQLEQTKHELQLLQDHYKKELKKSEEQKKKYEALILNFEKERNNLLEKELKKAQKKVEEAITQSKVEDTFKRHKALQEIKYNLPEIVKAPSPSTTGNQNIQNADEFAKKFPPGSKVYVASLQQDAIVQSKPTAKGDVSILSNSIRLQVPWQELKPPQQPQNPTAQLVRKSNSPFTVALSEGEHILDVRGKNVDDAISELEMTLDTASKRQEDRIKIIHGYGTEALKKAIRTYLSRSIYVKKWKAGSPEAGGDGVTWVELSND